MGDKIFVKEIMIDMEKEIKRVKGKNKIDR